MVADDRDNRHSDRPIYIQALYTNSHMFHAHTHMNFTQNNLGHIAPFQTSQPGSPHQKMSTFCLFKAVKEERSYRESRRNKTVIKKEDSLEQLYSIHFTSGTVCTLL